MSTEHTTSSPHAASSIATDAATDFGMTLPAPARKPVQQFGKYEVLGELGEGGMGRVYKAVDTELGRFVAVKVLRSTDPFEANRFRGEAEMIAALDHPNIVKVYDIATTPDERPYIVLELCEGGSLDRELGGNPQEPRRAAEMIETVARAVQFAHEKGVIHRDLKPANVLRGKDKVLKLTDFGLAKELEVSSGMTPSNAVMGTPSYMSPEQAAGNVKQLGATCDVYGLGAILYECITGRPPFRGVNMVDTLEQVRWAEPAPPSRLVPRIHRDLATICLKCLQKAPARRYQTAGELADDLRRWLNGETIAARRAPSWERLVRQVRRRPWQAATVVATVVMLTGALVTGLYVREKNAEDERRALREDARNAEAAAKEALGKAQEEAERQRQAAHRANEERLQKQARRSLDALNKIRGLVLEGELSRHPGLESLYTALSAYYDELIAQDDLGFDKVELADGLVKVGDLFGRTGQKPRAREAYRKAVDRCRPLAADPKARDVLVTGLLKGGQAAFDQEDYAPAEEAAAEVEKMLAAAAPPPTGPIANPRAAAQLAEADHLRGQVLTRRNEFIKAEECFKRSLAYRERLAPAAAADLPASGDERKRALATLSDVGRGYGYLGGALLDANKLPEAEAVYWRSHDIRKKVAGAFAADDNSAEALDAKFQLARSWNNFAALYTRQRALGAARYFAEQSLAVHTELTKLDPGNAEYKLDVCQRLLQLSELDIQMWVRPEVALDATRRAEIAANLERAKALVPEDPAAKDSPAKDRRPRRERGLHATVLALQGVLLADSEPEQARPILIRSHLAFEALCKPEPGVTVDPLHLYYWALARAMMTEVSTTARTPERIMERIVALREAVEKSGAKRRHPDDIEQFRAFRVLKDHPEFKKVMAALRAKIDGKADAKATAAAQ